MFISGLGMRENVQITILQVVVKFCQKMRKPTSRSIAQRRSPQGQSRGAQTGIVLGKTTQRRGVRHRRSQRRGVNFKYVKQLAESRGSHHSDVEGRGANIKI